MRTSRIRSLLGLVLVLALAFPASPTALATAPLAAPPPPDGLTQLQAETGATLRFTHHPATGQLSFLSLNGGAWRSSAGAALAAASADAAVVAEASARDFLGAYGSLFGLSGQAGELSVMRAPVREDGRAYVRFQQRHLGIPVFGGELIVQVSPSGDVEAVIGEALPAIALNTSPAVSGASAAQAALNAVAVFDGVPAAALQATEPALWIYNPALVEPSTGPARLVWRFEVTPLTLLPIRELVLVDALTGELALSFNQIETALVRSTHSASNTTSLPGTLICNESNPSCAGGDADAMDAHLHGGQTYTFYQNVHGRDSIDDAGLIITSTVHYSVTYDNAFWNGSQMVYGDAYGFVNADDVVAHELTHGVTQYESNLFYYYQSGAINESFSDVWGEFLDLTNGSGDDSLGVRWDLGEDTTGLGKIRDMADPPDDGDPDKMTSTLYRKAGGDRSVIAFDNGGVHHNSGVNNKAVYLMVDGDTFNGFTVTGLGITETAIIYYHTATNLLVSGSDYLNLYDALQQSCATLVNTNGITAGDCVEVKDALDAVEMNLQPEANHNTEATLCPAGKVVGGTVFSDDFESGVGGWTTAALVGSNRWFSGSSFAHSGTGHLLGDDGTATSDSVIAMNTTYTLPAGAYLHFAHAFGFQGLNDDGGIVQYSTNGGGSWTDAGPLFQDHGYNGVIGDGPLVGVSGFISDSHGYIASRLDLTSLAGQGVRFRFRMSNDAGGVDAGWYVDDVRIHLCVDATGVLYLPLVLKNSPLPPWTTIVSEDFEGAWPSGLWSLSEFGAGNYLWAKRSCRSAAGSNSAWAVGGGSNGSGLACFSTYPNDAYSWMVYGPFSLADATDAEFDLKLWHSVFSADDDVCLSASANGSAFGGTCYPGSSGGVFVPRELDLTNVFGLGDLRGDATVWVAVTFQSNGSGVVADGAHVDDVVVRKCIHVACAASAQAQGVSDDSGVESYPATFTLGTP